MKTAFIHSYLQTQKQLAALVGGITHAQMQAYLQQVTQQLRNERLLIFNTGKFADAPNVGRSLSDLGALKENS